MVEPGLPLHSRPHVWVNCAASLDGRLAYAGGARARLSGPEDLTRVQRIRAASDGILVGVGTVVHDDPSLRVHWELTDEPPKRGPSRIVVDGSGRIPPHARVLDGSIPTIVATTERNGRTYPPTVRTIVAGRDTVDLTRLFTILRDVGVERLLVEGGSRILASVLRSRLFDRWTIYYAPVVIGGTTAPPIVEGSDTVGPEDVLPVRLDTVERMGEGFVATYLPGP